MYQRQVDNLMGYRRQLKLSHDKGDIYYHGDNEVNLLIGVEFVKENRKEEIAELMQGIETVERFDKKVSKLYERFKVISSKDLEGLFTQIRRGEAKSLMLKVVEGLLADMRGQVQENQFYHPEVEIREGTSASLKEFIKQAILEAIEEENP